MQSNEKSINRYGKKKCEWCIANDYKRVREAKHEIFDQFYNDPLYLCDRCYKKWKEMNNIIIDLMSTTNEDDD